MSADAQLPQQLRKGLLLSRTHVLILGAKWEWGQKEGYSIPTAPAGLSRYPTGGSSQGEEFAKTSTADTHRAHSSPPACPRPLRPGLAAGLRLLSPLHQLPGRPAPGVAPPGALAVDPCRLAPGPPSRAR